MKLSKYGFVLPDYPDEADIPALVTVNVEVLERLLESFDGIGTGRIYSGDTEPEEDTYTWFAPYDPAAGIVVEERLNLGKYTGDADKLHVETEDGEIYTAENTAVTADGDKSIVIIT